MGIVKRPAECCREARLCRREYGLAVDIPPVMRHTGFEIVQSVELNLRE